MLIRKKLRYMDIQKKHETSVQLIAEQKKIQ
jgi:hypothetical protein